MAQATTRLAAAEEEAMAQRVAAARAQQELVEARAPRDHATAKAAAEAAARADAGRALEEVGGWLQD